MSQTPVFVAIHLVGLAVVFGLGSRRHPALSCAVAFPVGLAVTVLAALILLVVGIPYTTWTLLAAVAVMAVGSVLLRRSSAALDRATWRVIGWWTAGFCLVSLALSHWNLSLMNWDSHRMVLLGGVIGHEGALEPRTISELQSWGVFQVIAHSMAAFTRRDYLYSLQPVLGSSLLAIFLLSLWHATGHLGAAGRLRAAAVGLVALALFSLYAFAHHLFFIHTNLGTAVYLLGFVVTFWLADLEGDAEAMPVAFVFLFALAIHRIETPIIALIALTATVMTTDLPRRAITPPLAVFTGLVSAWYVLLAFYVSPDSLFLTPSRCIALALAVAAFFVWWMLSPSARLQRVNRHLHLVTSIGAALVLLAMFALRTDHMMVSLRSWVTSVATLPHWGYAFYVIAAALLVGLFTPRPPKFRTFTLTIGLSLAYTLMLVYARLPYRVALLDSANRMTIHVLPLLFFYLGLKVIPAATASPRDAPPAQVL